MSLSPSSNYFTFLIYRKKPSGCQCKENIRTVCRNSPSISTWSCLQLQQTSHPHRRSSISRTRFTWTNSDAEIPSESSVEIWAAQMEVRFVPLQPRSSVGGFKKKKTFFLILQKLIKAKSCHSFHQLSLMVTSWPLPAAGDSRTRTQSRTSNWVLLETCFQLIWSKATRKMRSSKKMQGERSTTA